MARSIPELCQAAYERCEQAKELVGEDRRLYLHDAIVKLHAALDVYAEPRPPGKGVDLPNTGGRGA